MTFSAPTVLRHAAELVRLLLKSPQPPRVLASQYLHEKKKLTTAQKTAISSLAFHTLRVLRLALVAATGDIRDSMKLDAQQATVCTAAALLLDARGLITAKHALPEALHPFAEEIAGLAGLDPLVVIGRTEALRNEAMSGDSASQAELQGALLSIPQWVLQLWTDECATNGTYPEPKRLAASLLRPAPLTLRVNTRRTSVDALLAALSAAGTQAHQHPRLEAAVVVEEREQLLGGALDAAGAFEVQDAGSQLIALALAASQGWDILDACAGGGGKTLHLADMVGDSASIVAADVEPAKLAGLRKRAARCGASWIETVVVPRDGDLDSAFGGRRFDAVIVDAPCSGFGTARRNPLVKWKLSARTVARLAERQYDILVRNAALVRSGGILLYATCSLLPTENEHVLRRFLNDHPEFLPDPLYPSFADAGLTDLLHSREQPCLTLCPDILDSDGFFIARMRRD